jgi:hypothetical protein
MAIYDFFLSRNNAASTPETYVGHVGRLFYNSDTGVIKISDGVTPGGVFIPYTIASDTVVGGIKSGPGVTIDSEGRIFIDSGGLSFTFGDFSGSVENIAGSDVAVLSSINLNEDIVIETNGTGTVDIVGIFNVHATNGTLAGSLAQEPILTVNTIGKIRMLVPNADQVQGGLEIVGNATGVFHNTNQTGVVIHSTGADGLPGRNYFDAKNNYSLLVGRRYNGAANATTPVLAGQTILRVVGQASTNDNFQLFGPCRVDMRATQDQLVGAQGGEISFFVTPLNTVAATGSIEVLKLNAETGVTTRDVVPQLTGTYNLGSPTLRWEAIYTSVMNHEGNIITTVDPSVNIVIGDTDSVGITDMTNRAVEIADLTVTNPITGSISGSAGSVGAANITGTTLASNVVSSSLTSVGTLTNLTVTNPIIGDGSQLTNVQKPIYVASEFDNTFVTAAIAPTTITNMTLTPPAGAYLATFASEYVSSLAGSVTVAAATDLATLYSELMNLPATVTGHAPAYGSETLGPGVYTQAGASSVAGTLTLNGTATDLFVFRCAGALTTGVGATIVLTGGAVSSNVWFVAQGAISTGNNTVIRGSMIANQAANTPGNGTSVEGRLFTINGAIGVSAITMTAPTGTINPSLTLGSLFQFSIFAAIGALTNSGNSIIALSIGSNDGTITGFGTATIGGSIYLVGDLALSVISYGIYIDGVLIPDSQRSQLHDLLVNGWPMALQTIATITAGQVVDVRTSVPSGQFSIGPAMSFILVPVTL